MSDKADTNLAADNGDSQPQQTSENAQQDFESCKKATRKADIVNSPKGKLSTKNLAPKRRRQTTRKKSKPVKPGSDKPIKSPRRNTKNDIERRKETPTFASTSIAAAALPQNQTLPPGQPLETGQKRKRMGEDDSVDTFGEQLNATLSSSSQTASKVAKNKKRKLAPTPTSGRTATRSKKPSPASSNGRRKKFNRCCKSDLKRCLQPGDIIENARVEPEIWREHNGNKPVQAIFSGELLVDTHTKQSYGSLTQWVKGRMVDLGLLSKSSNISGYDYAVMKRKVNGQLFSRDLRLFIEEMKAQIEKINRISKEKNSNTKTASDDKTNNPALTDPQNQSVSEDFLEFDTNMQTDIPMPLERKKHANDDNKQSTIATGSAGLTQNSLSRQNSFVQFKTPFPTEFVSQDQQQAYGHYQQGFMNGKQSKYQSFVSADESQIPQYQPMMALSSSMRRQPMSLVSSGSVPMPLDQQQHNMMLLNELQKSRAEIESLKSQMARANNVTNAQQHAKMYS